MYKQQQNKIGGERKWNWYDKSLIQLVVRHVLQ